MTQKIYGLCVDYGDGSSGIRWFKDKAIVDKILNDDEYKHFDEFYGNEGTPSETLEFPDTLNLEECGFHFYDDLYK